MTSNQEPAADFDDAPLGDVETSLPRDQFVAFVEDYLASVARHVEHVLSLRAAGDLAGLAREAHTLISVTGSYGLRQASVFARELQQACKAQDAARAQALVSDFAAATGRGCAAMRLRFVGPLPGAPAAT